MVIVQIVEKNDLLVNDFAIYELDSERAKKYKGKFAVSQGVFSDYALKEMGVDKLLSELKDYNYEGFFETQKEAYLHIKLVEMHSKLRKIESTVSELIEIVKETDTPTWTF